MYDNPSNNTVPDRVAGERKTRRHTSWKRSIDRLSRPDVTKNLLTGDLRLESRPLIIVQELSAQIGFPDGQEQPRQPLASFWNDVP